MFRRKPFVIERVPDGVTQRLRGRQGRGYPPVYLLRYPDERIPDAIQARRDALDRLLPGEMRRLNPHGTRRP